MSKENKGRIRHVCKFGKHGKFDAYDGRPEGVKFLEPFIELSAFERCQDELKQAAEKSLELACKYSDHVDKSIALRQERDHLEKLLYERDQRIDHLKKQIAVAVEALGWIRDIDGKSLLEMNLTTLEITAASAIKQHIADALKQIEEMSVK